MIPGTAIHLPSKKHFQKKLLWPMVLLYWHLKLNGEVVAGLSGHHSLENLVSSGVRRVVGDDLFGDTACVLLDHT